MKYKPKFVVNEFGISFQVWKNNVWPVFVVTYWFPDEYHKLGHVRRHK